MKSCLLLLLLASLLPAPTYAQAARSRDTIFYSSTCVNSTIFFGSPIFDSIAFPSSITWDFGDTASGIYNKAGSQQPRHIYSDTGTYHILLTVVNNKTDTIRIRDSIRVIRPMAYSLGPDIYLCGRQDTLLRAPAVPGAIYAWNDPDTTHTDTLRVKQSGVYTVSVNGCGIKDSIGVYISDTPRIDLGKDHVLCDGSVLTLNASTRNGHYNWLLNGNPLAFHGGQLVVQPPGGTYVASVNVPGCGLYQDTVRITFSQPNAPAFSLGPDTLLCPKQVFTLNATLPGATAYDWSTGSAQPTINVNTRGPYWVFVTIGGQCQVTDTVLVNYRGDQKLNFHDTAICKGSTLSLNADFGTGQYNWFAIPPQRDDQNQTGQATYFVYKPGTYAVTATVGQCVYKDTLTVSFNDSLLLSMAGDTTLCNGENYWLRVKGNANTYAWQDGSSGSSYHVTQSGAYTVMTVNGCGKDTLKATVNFAACGCNLLLPNAFTPDGDGHNDNFRPLHACQMDNYQMTIYNRYGELVFRTADPGQGWDGTFHGSKVPTGSFVWVVHYFNVGTKQPVIKKGSVLVIR